MPARDKRYSQTGENAAGDPMFSRTYTDAGSRGSNYADWTKAELEAELEARGLPKSGNKDDLIARLNEA